MDKLDYKILNLLKQNSRMKASMIGQQIHLSVSTVIERIKKMEVAGVIQKYTMITSSHKLGNDVSVLMEVSIEHERYNESFSEDMSLNPNVEACYYVTGDFDFIVKISCHSSEQLESIHKWIKNRKGVRATRTHYILKTVKEAESFIPLPENY